MNKLTQKQVSELSDYELNLAIYKLSGVLIKMLPDYCNNWNDLMREIERLNVNYGVYQNMINWRCILSYSNQKWESSAKTQIRAFAEAMFLLMQEEANNE